MPIAATFLTAVILCTVLSFISLLLQSILGSDVFNGQFFVLTIVITTAVLHYVSSKK